ncbi:uncharacterized protein YoxC [Arcanobacterium pluranimalium]|uniref:DUF948 domain-containing protein n=1 Tax=Arcanobacterium pluranimalium TaxID=108028 RepID=UPI00195C4CCE|nr:DUF948 domain-containing protein [Arcanobacterium pluranimalium]MBM7825447.1 uncharacterized protein YoxC [Arcanobacterium pluranimalium]
MEPITLGQIAGTVAALAFLVLVYFSIRPLMKLGRVLDRMAESLRELTEHTLPAIDEAAKTVAEANYQVKKLDAITDAAARTSEDISAMTTLVTSTVGAPFLAVRRGAEKVKGAFGKTSPTSTSADKPYQGEKPHNAPDTNETSGSSSY